jgi:hypothetical protein
MIKLTVNAAETFPIFILPFFESENLQLQLNDIGEQIGFEHKVLYADFKANAKETVIGMTITQQKVYFLGLGNVKNPAEVSKVFRSFFNDNRDKFKNNINVFLHNNQLDKVGSDIAQGIFLGEYQIAKPRFK